MLISFGFINSWMLTVQCLQCWCEWTDRSFLRTHLVQSQSLRGESNLPNQGPTDISPHSQQHQGEWVRTIQVGQEWCWHNTLIFTFRCRVDFRDAPSSNSFLNLDIIGENILKQYNNLILPLSPPEESCDIRREMEWEEYLRWSLLRRRWYETDMWSSWRWVREQY